ncbi:MAG: hydroxymethylbilane synthase [Thermoanaerobaculia bacterium]
MTMIRIGTRGSALAMWQALEVARQLALAGHESTIQKIRTTGDARRDVSLASIGGKGLFVKELEEALDRNEIDIAVHSLKDVPSIIPGRFALAAFLERADPRDAWISRTGMPIGALHEGAVIGTSAPRRRAQLANRFPHLTFEPIRGNVDTRINKTRNGSCDGVVLASAGLTRLGKKNEITSWFSVDDLVPAAGQGIVSIEVREDATRVRDVVASINHAESALAARCERGVLQRFDEQIDCFSAIGVNATIAGTSVTLRAVAADYDGRTLVRVLRSGNDPAAIAAAVYEDLVAKGAMDLVMAGQR